MSEPKRLLDQLEHLSASRPRPDELFRTVVEQLVAAAAEAASVHRDEVAIFIPRRQDAATFRFAAPEALHHDGSTFPAAGSLTQKVFATGSALINNNVKVKKPLSIYERAKISERHPRPIQKMVAIRLSDTEGAVGVLQVSRRGIAVREAGPDFGERDVTRLSELATIAAPYLRRALPADF